MKRRKFRKRIFACISTLSAGFGIYDAVRKLKCDVSAVCVGMAAGMGAFLLSAGTKGKRYALENSRIMIRQVLGGAQGQVSDILIDAATDATGRKLYK